MPLTTASSDLALGIRLEGTKTHYEPGDTVVGCVYRKQHVVSPKAIVTISLHGRTKSRIILSNGTSSTTYRGRFNLLSGPRNTLKVFDGPIHIPQGGEEKVWPFALTIPTHVENVNLGAGVSSDQSYLPLSPSVVATHEIPDSFNLRYLGLSTNMEGFVEYFLQAHIKTTGQGSFDSHEAALPLTVRKPSHEPPIIDFHTRDMKRHCSLLSYRLVPGMEEAELSFSQKTRRAFHSSKVPTLHFNYQITTPTVIQLQNPNPVPIVIQASPDWTRTTDIIQGVEQKARLKSLSLKITAMTRVICEGTFAPHEEDTDDKIDLQIDRVLSALEKPIFIPIAEEPTPIDIGKIINLRVGFRGRMDSRYPSGILHPSFTTYNIRHTHQLKWAFSAEIAGEEFRFESAHMVTLVRPSSDAYVPFASMSAQERTESWIHPPEEDAAPPSFVEVQKEDAIHAVQTAAAVEVGDVKKS